MDNYLETRYHTHPGGPGPSYFEFSISIKLTSCDHLSLSLPKSESLFKTKGKHKTYISWNKSPNKSPAGGHAVIIIIR